MKIWIALFVVVLSSLAYGKESVFGFEIQNDHKRSSTYWFPLLGFPVPGLPQYLNGQTTAGVVYSSVAFAGAVTSLATYNYSDQNQTNSDFTKLSSQDEAFQWGLQTYQDIGFVSVYHAFRSTAEQRKDRGDFKFLPSEEETSDQLFLSPFHVQYFIEPKIIIPLAAFAGALIWYHNSGSHGSPPFSFGDGLFTAGTSYNAGVSEEAFFRGYLMMNLRQSWNSDFWSLTASSVLFSAAHITPDNPFPWPQLIGGIYLGYLTQSNHYTLSRSVFFHTWYDVIAIVASLTTDSVQGRYFLPMMDLKF